MPFLRILAETLASIMKLVLFIILIILNQNILGQDYMATSEENKFCFTTPPLSFYPAYSGMSIRLGVEYKIKPDLSMRNEFGFYPQFSEKYSFENTKGYTGKIGIKKFTDGKENNSGKYRSLELLYKYHEYSTSDSIYTISNSHSNLFFKDYFVSKHVVAFNYKWGYLKVFKSGIVIDHFIGVGIRLKHASNTLKEEDNQNIVHSTDYGPNVFTSKAGNFIYPNLTFGVRIGYKIK